MSDDSHSLGESAFGFNPSYGYSLEQLLALQPPSEPKDFVEFWQQRYKVALSQVTHPEIICLEQAHPDWQVYKLSYTSTKQFRIQGWLLLPKRNAIKRGLIIGHGYGGREQPDFDLPFPDAALMFPCFRGLSLSAVPGVSSDPYWHVRHNLDKRDDYIIGGCVDDVWLATTAMLTLFPHLKDRLGYLGISFAGGIGALALAWEQRIRLGHLNVPTFGHQLLRLRLKSQGSADSVQRFYCQQRKKTLKVLRYYDAATAAKYIRIPMHCACAEFDPCVAPPGQFAIYNALPNDKKLFVLRAGHFCYPEQERQRYELLKQLEDFFAPLS